MGCSRDPQPCLLGVSPHSLRKWGDRTPGLSEGGQRTFPVPPRNKAKENVQQRGDVDRCLCRHGRTRALSSVAPRSRPRRPPLPASVTRKQKRLSFLPPSAAQNGSLGYLFPKPRYGGKAADHPGWKGTLFQGSRADKEECGGFNRGSRQGPLGTSSSKESSAGQLLRHR